VAQCIADSLGESPFAAELAEPHIEHAPKVVDDDAAAFLPDGTAFIGRLTTNVGLDGIELRDACEDIGCDRRRSARCLLEEATTHMCPAEGELHVADARELAVCGIAVDLQHAAEAGEMLDRLLGLSVGRVAVGDRGRVAAAPWSVVARIGPTNRAWCGLVPGRAPAPRFC